MAVNLSNCSLNVLSLAPSCWLPSKSITEARWTASSFVMKTWPASSLENAAASLVVTSLFSVSADALMPISKYQNTNLTDCTQIHGGERFFLGSTSELASGLMDLRFSLALVVNQASMETVTGDQGKLQRPTQSWTTSLTAHLVIHWSHLLDIRLPASLDPVQDGLMASPSSSSTDHVNFAFVCFISYHRPFPRLIPPYPGPFFLSLLPPLEFILGYQNWSGPTSTYTRFRQGPIAFVHNFFCHWFERRLGVRLHLLIVPFFFCGLDKRISGSAPARWSAMAAPQYLVQGTFTLADSIDG